MYVASHQPYEYIDRQMRMMMIYSDNNECAISSSSPLIIIRIAIIAIVAVTLTLTHTNKP